MASSGSSTDVTDNITSAAAQGKRPNTLKPVKFSSFHGATLLLPEEIQQEIVSMADDCTALSGSPHVKYPPIAFVSRRLRGIYLAQPSRFPFRRSFGTVAFGPAEKDHRRPKVTAPTIGETLNFPDLYTMARFFTHGPGL